MEDEDLEETNNEDCRQRARRLATFRKRRQREDKIESRPYSTCVSLYTSYDIFTVYIYHVAPRPNSSSACARPSLRIRIPSTVVST